MATTLTAEEESILIEAYTIKQKRAWRLSLEAKPRSAYLLRGASRSIWEHSIPPPDRLRYSITFRTVAPDGSAMP